MNRHGRRLSAFSVVALTTLALGVATGPGSSAEVGKAPRAGTAGHAAGQQSTLSSGLAARGAYKHAAKSRKNGYIKLDLLALNDFHGNLEGPTGSINGVAAGGATNLAHLIREQRKISRANGAKPLTVAAGDLIGASPLLSAAFHDEPTIETMNKIGLQVSAVGNHEFDEGWQELRRMANGGCLDDGDGANGADSCPGGKQFAGADFPYLGANVKWADPSGHKRDTVFPATHMMKVHGVKVGFIGMTLEGTPAIVSQAGIQGLQFTDEVETANALVPELRARGVESIVVLLHEGLFQRKDTSAYDGCIDPDGPALAIAQQLSPAIDAVVSGHTHQAYNCVVQDPEGQPRLLTSASSYGKMITKLHLLIDPRTRDIVRPAEYAQNMIVRADPDHSWSPSIAKLIAGYNTLVEPIKNAVIGHIEGGATVSRSPDADGGDSPLGNLIADSQKADTTVVQADGTKPVIALMNPGGIRADLVPDANGDVTYGAAFTVQPFNNNVVSMDLTGAQIKELLNEQWNGTNEGSGQKILQVSGLSYTWDRSEAALPTTDALVGDVMVDADGDPGTPMVALDDAATYRVVANSFLSDGGDSFATFKDSQDKLIGGLDIDSLRTYLEANNPTPVPVTDRISSQD
ncbi:bifunctional metallophosphatase/5'-nucleotidase [Nocardioides panaciterrulae]|uniref:5'-nucleotidase n=1 Tax=Nocardioides panaciterrulae TaxID=661492 RepID=A0A7Y9E664_9ACTN|nr:bifunctional metallophosphatase/5'-nucleotidase [Nocardioides panaciterrulae]NYD41974.1 5'-nucleotidase [Nocardioides panaciterrulae]